MISAVQNIDRTTVNDLKYRTIVFLDYTTKVISYISKNNCIYTMDMELWVNSKVVDVQSYLRYLTNYKVDGGKLKITDWGCFIINMTLISNILEWAPTPVVKVNLVATCTNKNMQIKRTYAPEKSNGGLQLAHKFSCLNIFGHRNIKLYLPAMDRDAVAITESYINQWTWSNAIIIWKKMWKLHWFSSGAGIFWHFSFTENLHDSRHHVNHKPQIRCLHGSHTRFH